MTFKEFKLECLLLNLNMIIDTDGDVSIINIIKPDGDYITIYKDKHTSLYLLMARSSSRHSRMKRNLTLEDVITHIKEKLIDST